MLRLCLACLKGTFKTDATKKPKTIDMVVKEVRNDGKTIVGIYEQDGDTLKWCAAEPGTTERPTELSSGDRSKRLFVTLRREKK
jgi:uncharacterized protein (TIGR03067 family)